MLIDIEQFNKNFLNNKAPDALSKLAPLYAHYDGSYALPAGFELFEYRDYSNVITEFTTHPNVLSNLFAFSEANHSGSVFVLWRQHDLQTSDQMPVMLFGDEGGMLVIAENVDKWMQLLTVLSSPNVDYDYSNPAIPHGVACVKYYPATDSIEEDTISKFRFFQDWIKKEFGYDPITVTEAEKLIAETQTILQPIFDKWYSNFV